jgi:CBS domain-containing protein
MSSQPTVSDVMITAPKTLPLDASIQQARDAFLDDHVHLLLITRGDLLHGTLTRADLDTALPAAALALGPATLDDRTTHPEEPIAPVHRRMVDLGQRRLAVVDSANSLLGLLCLKRDLTGFCSDSGVNARARDPR